MEIGEYYLFIIGIDRYADQRLPRLNNAVLDAQKVRDILIEKYQFSNKEGRLKELYDEEATQSSIIHHLKQFVDTIDEKDSLLIYFAGHGEYDRHFDVGYWIPHDAQQNQIGTYLSFDIVTRSLNAIRSRHTFLMTDSCYAGSIFTTNRSTVKNRLESIQSRWLLTAGRNEPVPDGKPGDHSPFARAVIYHLEANHEKRFRVSNFCDNVLDAVGNNSEALPRYGAIKTVGDMGGEFMFRLKEYAYASLEKENGEKTRRPDEGPGRSSEPDTSEIVEKKVEKEVEAPLRSMDDVIKKAKRLIAAGDLKVVFKFITTLVDDNSRRATDFIMQQSQFNSIQNQMKNGIVDPNFGKITLNRINYNLLSIVEELEEKDLKAGVLQPEAPKAPQPSRSGKAFLSELERQGLEQEAELLAKKLNFFKAEQVKVSDTSQKFTLQQQIEEIERQLQEVKSKLD
jgi:hypothetical protein